MKDWHEEIRLLRERVSEKLERINHNLDRFANSSAISQGTENCMRDKARAFSEVLDLIDSMPFVSEEE